MKQLTAPEYLNLLNSMSNFAGMIDKDGRLTFANKAPIESLGYVEEDVLGKIFWETPWFNRSKEIQEKVRDVALRVLEKGERVQIETSAFMKDGTPIPIILNASPLRDEEGEIIGAVVEGKPITEQKELEEKLRKAIEKLKKSQEELMTPVVQVWENILALPIIGIVDSYRAQKTMETLLDKIVETQSEMVIIDITGVASMNTEVANHLIKTVKERQGRRRSRAKKGEEHCGDACLVEECDGNNIIIAVIDGLGHGRKAEEASEVAVNFIKSHKNLPLDKIVRGVHSALSGTRGAVASISKISDGRIEFVGIGNISAQIVRRGDKCCGKFQQRLFSASGVLGWNLRHFKVFTYEFMSGWLVMNTDGVGHFIASEYLSENLREMAMKIMKEHGKVDDDATILILKR